MPRSARPRPTPDPRRRCPLVRTNTTATSAPTADRTRGGARPPAPDRASAGSCVAVARPPAAPCSITSSSAVPKKTRHAPAAIGRNLDGERRVEHHEHAERRARRRRAARAPAGFGVAPTLAGAGAPSGALHVLGIERRGGRADHQAAEGEQERPRRSASPTKASSSPAHRACARPSSVSSSSPSTTRERPRAQDQEHRSPAERPRRPDRDAACAAPRCAGPERPAIAAANASSASSGSTMPSTRTSSATAQRLPGEVAPAQRRAGRARSPRAARLASFGETERSAKRTSFGGV